MRSTREDKVETADLVQNGTSASSGGLTYCLFSLVMTGAHTEEFDWALALVGRSKTLSSLSSEHNVSQVIVLWPRREATHTVFSFCCARTPLQQALLQHHW